MASLSGPSVLGPQNSEGRKNGRGRGRAENNGGGNYRLISGGDKTHLLKVSSAKKKDRLHGRHHHGNSGLNHYLEGNAFGKHPGESDTKFAHSLSRGDPRGEGLMMGEK